MQLTPKQPPGRATRKARAFEAEIRRLREQGYTLGAIREALVDAGLVVSKSTVQREVARQSPAHRLPAHASADASVHQVLARATTADALPQAAPSSCSALRPALRSGRDIAQEFVRDRISNSLLRNRSNDESSRH